MPQAGFHRERTYAMVSARLACGNVLTYEAPDFLPAVGDRVPCRRHGYCLVEVSSGSSSRGSFRKRTRPRAPDELLDWLSDKSETTVHALRRQGFTLRIVAVAEREGVVEMDLRSGRVAVRTGRTA